MGKKIQPNASKSQAFLQRGQIGRDNKQWQTLTAKYTGYQDSFTTFAFFQMNLEATMFTFQTKVIQIEINDECFFCFVCLLLLIFFYFLIYFFILFIFFNFIYLFYLFFVTFYHPHTF